MDQYNISDFVRVKNWNLDGLRLKEVFERIFAAPPIVPLTIHVYEPLRDTNAQVRETIRVNDDREQVFIIFSGEGHGTQEYDKLLEQFTTNREFRKVKKENIIFYTSSFCLSEEEPYHHVSNISGILNTTLTLSGTELKTFPISRHFIFLNRMHRWQRQMLLENMHQRGLLRLSHASYLQTPPQTNFGHLYPMELHQPARDVTIEMGFDIDSLPGALFNIVSESSYESTDVTAGHIHIVVPGITEKTYKTILSSQIPIFLSTYKTVYHYRMLGYDVFDDIVDHSYDLIRDPVDRIRAITEELGSLQRYTVKELVELQEKLRPRFLKNYRLMLMYSGTVLETYHWYRKFKAMGLVS